MARLLDGWRQPDLGGRARFAFTGLGSSRFAAGVVAAQLRATGVDAWVDIATAGAAGTSGGGTASSPDLVLVAISASGRTREVLDAAARHRGTSLVVAVTNDPASPLAATADVVVELHAGEETGGIACRTFRATSAALALLTGAAGTTDDLRPVIDRLARGVATPLPRDVADLLDLAPSIDVLAAPVLLGVAEQAALMLREAPRLPAHAFETGEWLHTGVYLALPGHRAVLFPGSPSDAELMHTVRRRGGEVVVIEPDEPDGHPVRRAIIDSLAAERLAVELWRRANAALAP
jgi:fructoselysine-6-P-deglycase FrlB-like protein